LFPANWRVRVAISTAAIFAWIGVLTYFTMVHGWASVALLYWGPVSQIFFFSKFVWV
jgi:hypothetical protein